MTAWPHEKSPHELIEFYGDPRGSDGVNPKWYSDNIVSLEPPYQMRFSWGPECKRLLIHKKCHDAFATALENVKALYKTQTEIERHRMHLTGGAFCFRLMRGSATTLSIHSWGAALDIDPERNPYPHPWNPKTGIPAEAVKCFTSVGIIWRGANGDIDPQHFQAALR